MVEYIACPSCGRTLFNLEDVLHKVRNATSHLKGLDIAVMGCIVNGPGEMADADYGYVGKGPGIIALYRGREEIRKVPEKEGVQALIQLFRRMVSGSILMKLGNLNEQTEDKTNMAKSVKWRSFLRTTPLLLILRFRWRHHCYHSGRARVHPSEC